MEWKTENRKLKDIEPNENNPRIVTKETPLRIAEDIESVGNFGDIVLDNDSIILGGNQRYKYLVDKYGLEYKVSVKVPTWKMTAKQRRKVILLDNTSRGLDDLEALALEFTEEMKELSLEHLLDGMSIGEDPKEDEDFNPDAVEQNIHSVEEGDIYQLGNHRLRCGDSTKLKSVEKLMEGKKADMVFTDPPYNVDYTGKTEEALKIKNDKFDSNDSFYKFLLDAFTNLNVMSKEGAPIYICHSDSEGLTFRTAFLNAGYELKQCIIWNKNVMVMGRQDYQWKHEPILYGWKAGAPHKWYGGRDKYTVWDMDKPSKSKEHPTMKPIKLCSKAIVNSSRYSDLVLDLFGGSGSTLIACEQTRRICYMMELDPHYCSVIIERWEQFTKDKAIKLKN